MLPMLFLILPHSDSPSSLYHLGSLAFTLPYSSFGSFSLAMLCSYFWSRWVEQKGEYQPPQLAALRAELLHISDSEQGPDSPVSYGCHSALSAWLTELILNDRVRVKDKSLLGGWPRCSFCCVTSLEIALEVQNCSLTFLIIFRSSEKIWLLQVPVPPSITTINTGKKITAGN